MPAITVFDRRIQQMEFLASFHHFTLSKSIRRFLPYLFHRGTVYWHVKISNVRFIIVHRVNSHSLTSDLFPFSFQWLWWLSQHFTNNVRKFPSLSNHMPVFSHTAFGFNNLFVNVLAFNLFVPFGGVFFWFKWRWVCMCACLCFHWIDELCGGCREANTWEKKSTLFIFWVVDQMPIHTTKANEVYAINW